MTAQNEERISDGDIIGQHIFVTLLHEICSFSVVPEVITGDMESAMAVDLNPWVEYEFRVVATNPIGTGDPSIPSRMIRTNEAGKSHGTKLLFHKLLITLKGS